MIDRELLEAAARNAGYESGYVNDEFRVLMRGGCGTYDCQKLHPTRWNPLEDDGDALRLAVKLDLFSSPLFFHFRSVERFAAQDKDDCYATRRAIVRAAASIGKGEQG